MSQKPPIRPIEPVERVKPKEAAQPVETAQRVAPPAAITPALHIAPAAHAQAPLDADAIAAVNEERGREAVEQVEGVTAVAPPAAVTPADWLRRVTLTPGHVEHLSPQTWSVVQQLAHAHGDAIDAILRKHPDAARQLAHLLIQSGGATALEHWRHAHDATQPPPAAGPQPERPQDGGHAGVSLLHK